MSCCRSSSAFSPKVLEELRKEMDAVNQIFPNTQHLSIITSDGLMFVPFSKKEAERMHEDVLHPIASLRQAATAFTSSVEEVEVKTIPTIHLRGAGSMFSCYEIDASHLLVFYSAVNAALNVAEADKQMERVTNSLRLKLQNVLASK